MSLFMIFDIFNRFFAIKRKIGLYARAKKRNSCEVTLASDKRKNILSIKKMHLHRITRATFSFA